MRGIVAIVTSVGTVVTTRVVDPAVAASTLDLEALFIPETEEQAALSILVHQGALSTRVMGVQGAPFTPEEGPRSLAIVRAIIGDETPGGGRLTTSATVITIVRAVRSVVTRMAVGSALTRPLTAAELATEVGPAALTPERITERFQ